MAFVVWLVFMVGAVLSFLAWIPLAIWGWKSLNAMPMCIASLVLSVCALGMNLTRIFM